MADGFRAGAGAASPVVFEAGTKVFRVGDTDVEVVAPRPIRLDELGVEGMVLDARRARGAGVAPAPRAQGPARGAARAAV